MTLFSFLATSRQGTDILLFLLGAVFLAFPTGLRRQTSTGDNPFLTALNVAGLKKKLKKAPMQSTYKAYRKAKKAEKLFTAYNIGARLREYRIHVVADGEYATAVDGPNPGIANVFTAITPTAPSCSQPSWQTTGQQGVESADG